MQHEISENTSTLFSENKSEAQFSRMMKLYHYANAATPFGSRGFGWQAALRQTNNLMPVMKNPKKKKSYSTPAFREEYRQAMQEITAALVEAGHLRVARAIGVTPSTNPAGSNHTSSTDTQSLLPDSTPAASVDRRSIEVVSWETTETVIPIQQRVPTEPLAPTKLTGKVSQRDSTGTKGSLDS